MKSMNLIQTILATFTLVSIATGTPASKPNIVVILTDDMGFADLSITGAQDWATPHIDSLSQQGMSFTAGYVTAPQCAPSRAGLLSGVYQQRMHMATNGGATNCL